MKKLFLLSFIFLSHFSFAQNNVLVVKVNYSCLDFSFVDDKTSFYTTFKDGLNERGLSEFIKEREVIGSNTSLEMHELANGIYLLNYSGRTGTETIKIVKK